MVKEWADQHRAELQANWERARREQTLEMIEPRFLSIGAVDQLVDITGVEVVGDHRLRLTFADGTADNVDFADRRWGGVLTPLSDPPFFARVYVDDEAGTIAWPGGIDLAPEPLYEQARKAVR